MKRESEIEQERESEREMSMYTYVFVLYTELNNYCSPQRHNSGIPQLTQPPPRPWPLQDMHSLRGFCARINHSVVLPPPRALPTLLQYSDMTIAQYTTAMHYAILVRTHTHTHTHTHTRARAHAHTHTHTHTHTRIHTHTHAYTHTHTHTHTHQYRVKANHRHGRQTDSG